MHHNLDKAIPQNKTETGKGSHSEANSHFEVTEYNGWEWSQGAPDNHLKSSE